MDALEVDTLWMLVWGFVFAFVIEGGLGSVQDACRGNCDQLEGYFCDSFTYTCTSCQHCNVHDQNGCEAVCRMLKSTTAAMTSKVATTVSAAHQNISEIATTASATLQNISTNFSVVTSAPTASNSTTYITDHLGGSPSDGGVTDNAGLTPSPEDGHHLLKSVLLPLLCAGLVFIGGAYCCWRKRSYGKVEEEEDIEMRVVEERLLRREARKGDLPTSVTVRGNGDRNAYAQAPKRAEHANTSVATQTRFNFLNLGRLATWFSPPRVLDDGSPSDVESDVGPLSQPGSLHSHDEPGRVEEEQHLGAVPSRSPESQLAGRPGNPQGAQALMDSPADSGLSTTVQDGTHDCHEVVVG